MIGNASIESLCRDRGNRSRSGKSGDGDRRTSGDRQLLHEDTREAMAERESMGGHKGIQPLIIAGGFPCQDISTVGKRKGIRGEKSGLWFEMLETIRMVGPKYIIVENVSAITHRGVGEVLRGLSEAGYDAEWFTIRASDAGAPHRRERLFIIGMDRNAKSNGINTFGTFQEGKNAIARGIHTNVSYTSILGHASQKEKILSGGDSFKHEGWWKVEPSVGRVADGVPDRVDRIKSLGNAVVPQVAEFIGRRIMEYESRNIRQD